MAIKNLKYYVNENCLKASVKTLNKWLDENPTGSKERTLTILKRNYYVNKIIELDKSHLNFIQV